METLEFNKENFDKLYEYVFWISKRRYADGLSKRMIIRKSRELLYDEEMNDIFELVEESISKLVERQEDEIIELKKLLKKHEENDNG